MRITVRQIEYCATIIVLTFGCVFLLKGMDRNASTAQAAGTNQQITSTWTGYKLLGLSFASANDGTQGQFYGQGCCVTIGVAQWKVTGRIGNAGFKEMWSTTSDGNDMGVTFSTTTVGGVKAKRITASTNFTTADWKFDATGTGSVSFSTYLPGTYQIFSQPTYTGNGDNIPFQHINTSANCLEPSFCTYASGMYAYSLVDHLGHGGQYAQVMNSGTMLPLKWYVSGTYCDDYHDQACQ